MSFDILLEYNHTGAEEVLNGTKNQLRDVKQLDSNGAAGVSGVVRYKI